MINHRDQAIYDPGTWVFGVSTSLMHLSWMRTSAVRLKTYYNYLSVLCYNAFLIPELTKDQKEIIETHVF